MQKIGDDITSRFTYDGKNLLWREREVLSYRDENWNKRYALKIAGTENKKKSGLSHLRVWVNNQKFYVHRIIWTMLNGAIPEGMEIDHIDGNGLNNSIDNLRLVTKRGNHLNQPRSSKNTSGVAGVSWDNRRGKWAAYIGLHGAIKHLGYFDKIDDAEMARVDAQSKNGYHKNHGR